MDQLLNSPRVLLAISDVSWSAFQDMLTYKAKWHHLTIIVIDRLYRSSKICSSCGHQDGKKVLDVREWSCPACYTHHDRDINASLNMLREGLCTQG